MMAVFPLGIPAYYMMVLWRQRAKIYPQNKDAQVRLELKTILCLLLVGDSAVYLTEGPAIATGVGR
jgi:hypothetical protein